MNGLLPKILIIDNNDSFTYNLVQIFREYGRCAYTVIAHDRVDVAGAAEYDGILFSPGPGLPAEYPVMSELLDRYGGSKSFLGICLGHQAIAEHFGARLYNLGRVRHGIAEIVTVTDPDEMLFTGTSQQFTSGLYHSWAVTGDKGSLLSENRLIVTATGSDGVIMGLRHCDYDIRSVQFHPESFITTRGRIIIHNWIDHLV